MLPRWQKNAVAIATFMVLGLPNTYALSLGKLTVISSLGEPLRAEVDIAEMSANEADSLKAAAASPAAFVAAGMEYNPAMSNLQVSLQRRADGRPYLRLSSDKAVNEPFVDLLLETTWASGRIVRDYVMLFDPPHLRNTAPTPLLAQSTNSAAAPTSAPSPSPSKEAPKAPLSAGANNAKPADSKPANAKPASSPAGAQTKSSADSVLVQKGDSASKIANRIKPEGVSLDQMLVALLQNNPNAFVASNLNRLRSGAILNVPAEEAAKSITQAQARKIVIAHSKDFDSYRQGIAAKAAPVAESPNREATGNIQSQVDDKKAAASAADKLTLSKGSVQADKIAKDKEAQQQAERSAELNKNIEELNKLSAAANASGTGKPAPTTVAPAVAAAPAPDVAAPDTAAPKPAEPPAPPPAPPAKVVAPPPPPPAAEPSFIDSLLQDPLIPAAGAGLLALIGGFVALRLRQRRNHAAAGDSSFLESRLQPDSFFGATGGQKIDTSQEASASSMVYSPSQLDAADDVDPVAEADVYLAYGRDLQAEEILKEAAQTQPGRMAVYTKLMDIYAKRKDSQSLEATAHELLKYTNKDSEEWAHASKLGLAVDPHNPFYQSDDDLQSPPTLAQDDSQGDTVSAPDNTPESVADVPLAATLPPSLDSVDLDLDLDFSPEATPAVPSDAPSNEIAFTVETAATQEAVPNIDDYSTPVDGSKTAETIEIPSSFMDLDMSGLSLDLNSAPAPLTDAPEELTDNPLETKLALADEFMSIGDEDGARALIEEVLAEASGDMRSKAQQALANLK